MDVFTCLHPLPQHYYNILCLFVWYIPKLSIEADTNLKKNLLPNDSVVATHGRQREQVNGRMNEKVITVSSCHL